MKTCHCHFVLLSVVLVLLVSGCSQNDPKSTQPPQAKSVSRPQDAQAATTSPGSWKQKAVAAIKDYLSKPERKELAAQLEKPLATPEHYRVDDLEESIVVTVFGLEGGGTGIKVTFDRATGKQLSINMIPGK